MSDTVYPKYNYSDFLHTSRLVIDSINKLNDPTINTVSRMKIKDDLITSVEIIVNNDENIMKELRNMINNTELILNYDKYFGVPIK